MADPLASNIGTLNSLLGLFTGTKRNEVTSGGGSTTQTMLSKEAVDALLKDLLENGPKGLASVASGQKAPGLYNTTSRTMLMNDLLARSTAEVEKARAPTVISKATETRSIQTPAALGSGSLLGAAGLLAMSPAARKKLGLDGILDDVKGAFSGVGADTLDLSSLAAQDYADFGTEGVSALGNSLGFSQGVDYASPIADFFGEGTAGAFADFGALDFFGEGTAGAVADFASGGIEAAADFGMPWMSAASFGLNELFGYDGGVTEAVTDIFDEIFSWF